MSDASASQLLTLPDADACRWDCVALGEVMLRFDPGPGRIRTARRFDVYEGGGEYNAARALSKGFGQRTAILTAFPRNELGRLCEDLILQGGVDVSQRIWRDPQASGARMGLNFVERGFGVRPALGCSDRAHSAAAQITAADFDWEAIFGAGGTRWFHTGGIFSALSQTTFEATEAAMTAARRHGAVVSYDLNYRASLWSGRGGYAAATDLNRRLLPLVDVLIGGFDDFTGLAREANPTAQGLDAAGALARAFPNLKVVAATVRHAHSANLNSWGASLWAADVVYHAKTRDNLEIYDRVGGGDGFAAGMIYAFLAGLGPQAAVDYGAAHGALVMTTPGDSSMADLTEVRALVRDDGARTIR
ncbi:MAG TPA: sugar kinase [Caulobacteraceae bacterium]|nr:sugar kinase [Caulobacteraceae bacterium]